MCFVKQKTADEMRISDWSSDVCSSDLPDSYYASRELIPADLMPDLERAKIVITNYHAFKLRERIELSKGGRLLLQGRGGDALETRETEGQKNGRASGRERGCQYV